MLPVVSHNTYLFSQILPKIIMCETEQKDSQKDLKTISFKEARLRISKSRHFILKTKECNTQNVSYSLEGKIVTFQNVGAS